jgi:dienelactone hydrolase
MNESAALPRMLAQSSSPSGQSSQGERPTLNRTPTQPPAVPPTSAPAPSTPASAPAPAQPASAPEAARPDSSSEIAKPTYPDLLPRFDYDTKTGLEQRETNIEKRDNSMFIELNYAGSNGDRVPAYLIIPHGKGPFPAIIWGHWLKQGSPLANKDEFLDEALALAHSGVLSLLIDAPQARHDFGPVEKDTLAAARQQGDAAVHQVIDLRRAVDLLRLRRDVDPKRIAYVGHSWDAHVGAIFAGVESRVCCFVLMASGYFDEEDTVASHDPQTLARIKEVGAEQVRDYFHDYAFDDPVYFLGHTTSESIFLQFSAADLAGQPSAAADAKTRAQKYLDAFSSHDKQMTIYDAPHALNSAARLDRVRWLEKHLGFKKVDEKELEAVPQVK